MGWFDSTPSATPNQTATVGAGLGGGSTLLPFLLLSLGQVGQRTGQPAHQRDPLSTLLGLLQMQHLQQQGAAGQVQAANEQQRQDAANQLRSMLLSREGPPGESGVAAPLDYSTMLATALGHSTELAKEALSPQAIEAYRIAGRMPTAGGLQARTIQDQMVGAQNFLPVPPGMRQDITYTPTGPTVKQQVPTSAEQLNVLAAQQEGGTPQEQAARLQAQTAVNPDATAALLSAVTGLPAEQVRTIIGGMSPEKAINTIGSLSTRQERADAQTQIVGIRQEMMDLRERIQNGETAMSKKRIEALDAGIARMNEIVKTLQEKRPFIAPQTEANIAKTEAQTGLIGARQQKVEAGAAGKPSEGDKAAAAWAQRFQELKDQPATSGYLGTPVGAIQAKSAEQQALDLMKQESGKPIGGTSMSILLRAFNQVFRGGGEQGPSQPAPSMPQQGQGATLSGQRTSKPDGTYRLPDGRVVTVKGGIIQ